MPEQRELNERPYLQLTLRKSVWPHLAQLFYPSSIFPVDAQRRSGFVWNRHYCVVSPNDIAFILYEDIFVYPGMRALRALSYSKEHATVVVLREHPCTFPGNMAHSYQTLKSPLASIYSKLVLCYVKRQSAGAILYPELRDGRDANERYDTDWSTAHSFV